MYMSEYANSRIKDSHDVSRTDFTNPELRNILCNLDRNYDAEVLRAIRLVGNDRITGVNINRLEYEVDGKVLSMSQLSSAEFFFMLAEIARQTGVVFAMIGCIRIMSPRTLKLFVQEYMNVDIYLIAIDGETDSYYRFLKIVEEE